MAVIAITRMSATGNGDGLGVVEKAVQDCAGGRQSAPREL
jgi:hypothetical protein